MNPRVRPEQPADAEAIRQVVAQAFREAPHTSGTEHCIVGALRSAGALAVSLLAVVDARIVGHVAVSPVTVGDGAAGWYGLGPVAVLPGWQRQGIGSRLIEEALDLLRRQGAAGCVVLGEPGYYGRFGFRVDLDLVLEGVPPGYVQSLVLDGAPPHGAVGYHPAFAATS